MIYSIHAWNSDQKEECFRGFPVDASDPNLAIANAMELLMDNPAITLVMIRMWFKVVRFDHELGAVQFIRPEQYAGVTARVNRLKNLIPQGTQDLSYRPDVLMADRKPIMVQLEYNSPDDLIKNKETLLPYLLDDPPTIIIPV